ncbi:MAG: hypothetical protein GC149_16945 [Gammaproteobacteria bacterium]|nr:hypothetical protein [Gammaproteobacteria bacterium]
MSDHAKQYVAAVFQYPNHAQRVVEDMIKHDFPMDQVSLLHKAGGHGDDLFGIAYTNEKERFKVWGSAGAFWGSLGGLLAGAAGLLLLPGVGPVLIAGPLIDAIAGAAVGAGLMATGAAVTHLTIAMRRMGIPEEKLEILHQAVMNGKLVLILHCGSDDPEVWRRRLAWNGAEPIFVIP